MKISKNIMKIVKSPKDIHDFLGSLGLLNLHHVIIKPNWVDSNEGTHTDAHILDWLFSELDCKITIVESYTIWRNKHYLIKESWPKQAIKPEEGCLDKIDKKIDWIRKQDKWFFKYSGIGNVLTKHNAEYINITEEVINNRVVNPETIQNIVNKSFGKINNTKLLSFFPKKLFGYKDDCVFISLGKVKTDGNNVVTLSTKNMFGLIPDPSRWPEYHGLKDEFLFSNIIEINKIYKSIFKNIIYMNEGVFSATEGPWPKEIRPVKDWGRIVGGTNCVEVDSLTAYLMGVNNVEEIPSLSAAGKVFGNFDRNLLKKIPNEYIKPLKFW